MMKKLLNTLILCGLTSNGYCAVSSPTDIQEPKLSQNDIAKLPQTGEGVRIVPDSELYHVKLPKKQQIAFDNAKKLGYVKKKSYEAINLLHYEKEGFLSSDDQKYYDSTDPMDTHLKRLYTQIPLAFPYHPISFVAPKDTIGFGAAMTFKDGWTGITQIFKYKKIGICNYLKTSVALNGSAIRLSKERISFYINGKPAVAVNEGSEAHGFLYSVEWYGNDYFHDLTCAQPSFSLKAAKDMAELAHLIDKG